VVIASSYSFPVSNAFFSFWLEEKIAWATYVSIFYFLLELNTNCKCVEN
jgi:hypothetical protein